MSASLRMLYLQPAASFGGAERQAAQNIRLLPRFGVEVLPVVGPGREIVDFLEDSGVRRYLLREDLPDDPKAPRDTAAKAALAAGYVRSFFGLVRDLEREARDFGCEALFASRPFAWAVAGELGRRLSLPVVWRAGTDFEHWLQPPALHALSRVFPPRAVVYTSTAVHRNLGPWIRGREGERPTPAFVIHNGVDAERFSPRRRVRSLRGELGLDERTPVVGFVARIAPEKGTGMLVESVARLKAAVPSVRVLIAGDSGWRPRLEKALARAGCADVVRLLGFVREVERVYATADVVVSTSASEGCPNALLEAMAMGRPVVATRVGGTGEIVRDGVDGVLVPPGDAAAFVDAVARLLADPERRAAIGRAAARSVATGFSVRAQVARLAEVVHWAAGRPQSSALDGVAARASRRPPSRRRGSVVRRAPPTQPSTEKAPLPLPDGEREIG